MVKCNIRCTGKSGVIYDSLNPNSLSKIRDLETGKNCFNKQEKKHLNVIT